MVKSLPEWLELYRKFFIMAEVVDDRQWKLVLYESDVGGGVFVGLIYIPPETIDRFVATWPPSGGRSGLSTEEDCDEIDQWLGGLGQKDSSLDIRRDLPGSLEKLGVV
jgi:hypothetical protein